MKEFNSGVLRFRAHAGWIVIKDSSGETIEYMDELQTKEFIEFLQANLTTKSTEDADAHKVAVSSADEMVREYKQDGDNNWNIS